MPSAAPISGCVGRVVASLGGTVKDLFIATRRGVLLSCSGVEGAVEEEAMI